MKKVEQFLVISKSSYKGCWELRCYPDWLTYPFIRSFVCCLFVCLFITLFIVYNNRMQLAFYESSFEHLESLHYTYRRSLMIKPPLPIVTVNLTMAVFFFLRYNFAYARAIAYTSWCLMKSVCRTLHAVQCEMLHHHCVWYISSHIVRIKLTLTLCYTSSQEQQPQDIRFHCYCQTYQHGAQNNWGKPERASDRIQELFTHISCSFGYNIVLTSAYWRIWDM